MEVSIMLDKITFIALAILCVLCVIKTILYVIYLIMRVIAYFLIRQMMKDGDPRTYDEIVSDEFPGLIL